MIGFYVGSTCWSFFWWSICDPVERSRGGIVGCYTLLWIINTGFAIRTGCAYQNLFTILMRHILTVSPSTMKGGFLSLLSCHSAVVTRSTGSDARVLKGQAPGSWWEGGAVNGTGHQVLLCQCCAGHNLNSMLTGDFLHERNLGRLWGLLLCSSYLSTTFKDIFTNHYNLWSI